MDMISLFFLLLLAALGGSGSTVCAPEVARKMGKLACSDASVQFLDNTVANIRLALVRDKSGRRVLRRTHRFEFSETGNTRLEGRLTLLGDKIESVTMEPYQILP